ncbi:septal ring lytic transglycosylase RlpA family protein [Streptomyces albidocamelliae]|uniref:Septal ring lytic transglycosylase RlpA family protein n=1 Tax=Streptomyces albidocamelliae TaxID=2981135 RepID=A0ABY6EMR0_9ACTN|nr:septal ring lytic transglycosylase RlpA family protein [Streptomyces sp. HUAS 14-6]UXY35468.1 septal ring lytic transglycosylase RlpA family protein [Streptomyces sp. HUAS 14-6]
MSRRRTLGTKKKIALLVSAAAVAGGGAFALASTSNAAQSPQQAKTLSAGDSTVCQGLATAHGNNDRFIADQKANPDAQSAARIANREAVIKQIEVQQKAAGCTVGESAQDSQGAQNGNAGQQGQQGQQGQGQQAGGGQQAQPSQPGAAGGGAAAAGQQVCKGSTVTLSGEGGAPAASSNQFPAGTTLKVTNLDNNKSTTVKVTSVSGSCVLLNNSAFEQVREPGKFLIRRAVIEKVG